MDDAAATDYIYILYMAVIRIHSKLIEVDAIGDDFQLKWHLRLGLIHNITQFINKRSQHRDLCKLTQRNQAKDNEDKEMNGLQNAGCAYDGLKTHIWE